MAIICLLFSITLSAAQKKDVTADTRELFARETIVRAATELIGTDYWPGGQDTDYGYDCSGLTQYCYYKVGVNIPRRSVDQFSATRRVERASLKKGDLVFFNTRGMGATHVGIYIGNNRFIHAPGIGKEIRIDTMGKRYWNDRYFASGRADFSRIRNPKSKTQDQGQKQ